MSSDSPVEQRTVRIGRELAVVVADTVQIVVRQRDESQNISGPNLDDHSRHIGVGIGVQGGVGQILLDPTLQLDVQCQLNVSAEFSLRAADEFPVDIADQLPAPAAQDRLADVFDTGAAPADLALEVAGQRIVLEQHLVAVLGGTADPADGLGRDGAVGIFALALRNDVHVVDVHKLDLGGEDVVLGPQLQQWLPLIHVANIIDAGDQLEAPAPVGNTPLKISPSLGQRDAVDPTVILGHNIGIGSAAVPCQKGSQVPDPVVHKVDLALNILGANAELGAVAYDVCNIAPTGRHLIVQVV